MVNRILVINVKEKEYRIEELEREETLGALAIGIYYHFKYKSYLHDIFSDNNIVVLATGPFTGILPGFSRGVIIFRSPLHGNLHASTGGDFGEFIRRAGYDAVIIEGKSELPTLVYIKDDKVVFEEKEEIPKSTFDLEQYMYRRYKDIFGFKKFRVIVAGMAGKNSYFGSLITSKDENSIGIVPSIFGRGGAGSVLVQAHNTYGIAIGGSQEISFIPEYKQFLKEIIEATKKYREKGTFGANYPHLKENTIMFNWKIFELEKKRRLTFFKKYIESLLLKDYKFKSETCGEKCIAACKKIEDIKLDYEPVEGLGPFIGVFHRDLVKELVHLADSYGFDAIYLGQFLGFVMEAIENGIIDKDLVGISESPTLDPEKYNESCSKINYEVAKTIINKIARGNIFATNLRRFSDTFKAKDLALYIPYGKEFDMTPNFYWTLGLALPILMHGKYYSDYHIVFKEPEDYAKICANRTISEFILDNAGICRFHRGWIEPKFETLLGKEFVEISKEYLKKLYEYRKLTGIEPEFYDSKKTIDVYSKLILEFGTDNWKERAKSNPKNTLLEYWNLFEKTYYDILLG